MITETKELGNLGERIACEYLVKNGYKIIGRNYRINFGEIDIIAKKFTPLNKIFQILVSAVRQKLFNGAKGPLIDYKTIHFVEVKTLNSTGVIYPEEHVDYRKQRKLRQLAEIWLSKNRFSQNASYQIDIVAVSGDRVDFFENVMAG